MSDLILANMKIYTDEMTLEKAAIVIRDQKFHAITEDFSHDAQVITFPENYHLVPGFIDIHVHGANGSDVMDANITALTNISEALAKEGTTGFLATTMTADAKEIEEALRVLRNFTAENGAKLLGIHLEGPFLSPQKTGAQRSDKLLLPNIELIERWHQLSHQKIKMVTLAPELTGADALIRHLQMKNIIAAAGHTDANYAEGLAAIAAGCRHGTHLFNAMRSIHHREPGILTALLLQDQVTIELILDEFHLHPAIIQLAQRIKPFEKIILVTDAMRAKCMCDGEYDLGGQAVIVKNNRANLANGTLAGSVLKMNNAFRNAIKYMNCSIPDAIKMTSENPARLLGIFSQTGSITVGKRADLVVLDEHFNVVLTIVDGKIIYRGLNGTNLRTNKYF